MRLISNISTKKYFLLIFMIYMLIFSLLIMMSFNFDFTQIINGGDTDAYLDPYIPLKKGWFIWEDSAFGRINLMAYIQLFYTLPLVILYFFVPLTCAHFLYWVFLFSFIPFSCYILSYYFTKNHLISFFIGILYALNLFTAIVHHTPVYHLIYFHAVTPLLIYLSFKMCENKKIFDLNMLLFSLLFIPLLRVINMYALYLVFIPFLSFITIKYYKNINHNFKFYIKKFSIITTIILILSSPYIITFYTSYTNQLTESDPNVDFSKVSVEASKTHANILNIIRFSTTYGWETEEFWTETSGVQGFNAAETYHTNPLLILLTLFPFLLPLIILITIFHKIKNSIKNYLILILSLIVLFIFLAKMINPPFGSINDFFYDSFTIFLLLFRSAWQYMQVPILVLICILLSIGIKEVYKQYLKNNKKLYLTIGILFIINTAYILPAISSDSNLINESWVVTIPDEYYDVADFLNDQNEDFRILPLPLSKHFTGYAPYQWGYAGPDILYSLLNKPLVDKIHNPVLSKNQLKLISEIENQSHQDLLSLLEHAKRLNVKYILLRNDINESHKYIKLWSSSTLLNQSMNSIDALNNTYVFGNLTLFELDYYPRIYSIDKLVKEKHVSHIAIGKNNSVDLSYNDKFETIHSFSLKLSFYLNNKSNEFTNDWQQINQGIILSDMFKISISPLGTLWLFLYADDGTYEGYTLQLSRDDVLEKKIYLHIELNNHQINIQKDGFLYSFQFNSSLKKNLSFIKIGGEINSEKMVGKIYDYSLTINNKIISNMNDIIQTDSNFAIFDEYNNITIAENICNYLENSNLSILNDIFGDWKNIDSLQKNPTEYLVSVDTNTSTLICFAESYDPNWEMTVYRNGKAVETLQSKPLFSTINGFFITETGNLDLTISYKSQQWFFIGIISAIITILCCVTYIFIDYNGNLNKIKIIGHKIKRIYKGR